MARPYRIGKHKATEPEFDSEVRRLYKLGLSMLDIGKRLRRDRTTVWRSLQRTRKANPEAAREAKKERQYYKETSDEFLSEPLIKQFVEDMKTRRVGQWKGIAGDIKRMCDDLQIFPDQLDLDWGRKWLAMKTATPLDVLRRAKISARGWFKSQGVTDYELTLAGFDAKHYGVGKWKHVKLTEGEIKSIDTLLCAQLPEARFAFRFGIETCRTLEPIWNLRGEQFYTLEMKGGKMLYCVNIFRKKTEKAGVAYKTAYVSPETYTMAKALSDKNGGTIMDGFKPEAIYAALKQAYRDAGIKSEYFYMHPIHALRHCGAQRLLERTNFNRAVVAELGGWEAEKTLEDHYGGVPIDIIRGFAADLLGGESK